MCETTAHAQFYLSGSEPASVKWSHITTQSYDVIYRSGLDSLARVYARSLEAYKIPNSYSSGWVAGQTQKKALPVILHSGSVVSNGMVTWTPSRMDLYTFPSTDKPEAQSWARQLAVHEGRHYAQMQYLNYGPFITANKVIGQLAGGALCALYCGPAFFEGDAVVAETALSGAGRGRAADFLEYYRASFNENDMRNYQRWRWGSAKYHTPDHYKAGYLSIAGPRVLQQDTLLVNHYYNRIFEHKGFAWRNWDRNLKEDTGLSFDESFAATSSYLKDFWAAEDSLRAPFMPSERLSRKPIRFQEYRGITTDGGWLYAIKSGDYLPASLVRIAPDGREFHVGSISGTATPLQFSFPSSLLFWSEKKGDVRWEMKSSSDIWCWSPIAGRQQFTTSGRIINPAVHPDEALLAAIEFPEEGGSAVVVFSIADRAEIARYPLPAGEQGVECAWLGGRLLVLSLTDDGFFIKDAASGESLLGPVMNKIFRLFTREGELYFSSDMNGVEELYRLENGKPIRLTNLKNGGADFCFFKDHLYYTTLSASDRLLSRTAAGDLPESVACTPGAYRFPLAEELSAQEQILPDFDAEVEMSEPEPYSRIQNAFRVHSWLPVYFVYDNVSALSLDVLMQNVRLGASAYVQNSLGTLYGSAALGINRAHADISYTGLFPVFKASYDYVMGYGTFSFSTYLPFNFSEGGWSKGVVPRFSITSDGIVSTTVRAYVVSATPELSYYPRIGIGVEGGKVADAYVLYGYGYLPGLREDQGFKWTGLFNSAQSAVEFTASYAIPFGFVDWDGMSPLAYLRNFELLPHGRVTHLWNPENGKTLTVPAIGAGLDAVLGNLAWVPYTTRIGFKVSHNINYKPKPWMVEAIFSIDL